MRRWLLNGLLGLLVAGTGVAGVVTRPAFAVDDPWVAYALVAPAGLLLALAHRWPWPVLLAEVALLIVADSATPFSTNTAQAAVPIALGFLAYRARWPATIVALGLAFTATMINVIDPGNDLILSGPSGALRFATLLTVEFAPIAVGRYLRALRDAAEVARERAREAEAAQEVRMRAARLHERTALARDLHDILAHHIGAMALQSGAALYAVRKTGSADDAVEALDAVRGTSIQVLNELRVLLEVLRDPETLDAPATEPEQAMDDAVRRIRAAGLDVADDIADVAGAPLVLRTTAVRVVQEGLTNSLKHAGPGARARVRVGLDDGEVRVTVSDGGPPAHPPESPEPPGRPPGLPGAGQGLLGLRERVALLGGTLTAGPDDDGGWRLDARLPIREAA